MEVAAQLHGFDSGSLLCGQTSYWTAVYPGERELSGFIVVGFDGVAGERLADFHPTTVAGGFLDQHHFGRVGRNRRAGEINL